jgi:hypothetical protein
MKYWILVGRVGYQSKYNLYSQLNFYSNGKKKSKPSINMTKG